MDARRECGSRQGIVSTENSQSVEDGTGQSCLCVHSASGALPSCGVGAPLSHDYVFGVLILIERQYILLVYYPLE